MLSPDTLSLFGIDGDDPEALSFEELQGLLQSDPDCCPRRQQPGPRVASSKTRGFKQMRSLHEQEFDTVDDLDTSGVRSLTDFYEMIVGPAMRQNDVCGILLTGPCDANSPHTGFWGHNSVKFEGYEESWWVRSYPKGRAGRPVERDEVRKLAVLSRPSAHSRESKLTIVKMWRFPEADSMHINSKRHYNTFGAHGTNMTGVHLFEHHGTALLESKNFQEGRDNYHAVLGSFVTVVAPKTQEELSVPDRVFAEEVGYTVESIHADMTHKFVIASSLGGFEIPDGPHRQGVQRLEARPFEEARARTVLRFTDNLRRHHLMRGIGLKELFPEEDEQKAAGEHGARLLAGAESCSEQLSYSGMLDMLADPIFNGSHPDVMVQPSGIPLLVALAVRIACHPERVGLTPGSADDRWAVREAACIYESIMSAPLPYLEDDDGFDCAQSCDAPWRSRSPRYAIDIVLNNAIVKVTQHIALLKAGASATVPNSDVLAEKMGTNMTRTLEMMFRSGVGLCVDVLGVEPRRSEGHTGVYTNEGLAEGCCDPVEQSRYSSAYKAGLGNLEPRVDPMRCTTRGERQMALVRVLSNVERWLSTGTFLGARHVTKPPSASSNRSVERVFLKRDEDGGLAGLSKVCTACDSTPCVCSSKVDEVLSRCFSPASALTESANQVTEAAAAVAEMAAELNMIDQAAASSSQKNASRCAAGGKRKKKLARAAAAAAAAASEAAPAAAAAESEACASKQSKHDKEDDVLLRNMATNRGRGRRAAENDFLIDKAVESLQRKRGERNQRLVRDVCRDKLNGRAIEDASVLFGEIMQCGACHGTTESIDMQAFLVGPGAWNRCANCWGPVNVVENMAFGGSFAACSACNHPRCLSCVQNDIDVLASPAAAAAAEGPLHRDIANCSACAVAVSGVGAKPPM